MDITNDMLSIIIIVIGVVVIASLILIKRKKKHQTTDVTVKEVHLPIDDSGGLGMPKQELVDIPDPTIYPISTTYSDYRKIIPMTDIVLVTAMMSGIILFVSVYYMPQMGILMSIIGGVIFLPIGFGFGMLLLSNFRIKLLRKITKKNLGFVKFIYGGRTIKTIVANLDKDTINFEGGVYLTDNGEIKSTISESVAGHKESKKQKVQFEDGIPTIYFDVDDLLPVEWKKQQLTDSSGTAKDDKFRSPKHISATLNKEIAVEKAKTMKAFKSRENILILIVLILCVVTTYLTYQNYNTLNKVDKSSDAILNMRDIINQLIRQESPSTPNNTITPIGV